MSTKHLFNQVLGEGPSTSVDNGKSPLALSRDKILGEWIVQIPHLNSTQSGYTSILVRLLDDSVIGGRFFFRAKL